MQSDTQRLTRANLELRSRDERRRKNLTAGTVFVTLLLAGSGAYLLRAPGNAPFGMQDTSAVLTRENAELRAELQRMRTEVELEQATRAALTRQAGELQARIKELTNRLAFLAARDSRATESP
jgi:phage shock protein A